MALQKIGTNGNDRLRGTIFNDDIFGLGGDDTLIGRSRKDVLVGGRDNDILYGGFGHDVLIGVEASIDRQFNIFGPPKVDVNTAINATPGRGEIDTLTGGFGKDQFILGDSTNVYYDDGRRFFSGRRDYAILKDFNPGEDKIILNGSSDDYGLKISGGNTQIYFEKTGFLGRDELIGVVEGNTGLNLNANYFDFV